MKSIEERAEELSQNYGEPFDSFGIGFAKGLREGYIIGANKQKAIEIEKACEWLKKANGQYFNGFLIVYTQGFIKDFKKAMEEGL